MAKTVDVGNMGSAVKRVVLADDATVSDALTAAGLSADGKEVRCDGDVLTLTERVEGGSLLILTPKVKGGQA